MNTYSFVTLIRLIIGGGRNILQQHLSLWKPVFTLILDVPSELPDPTSLPPNVRLFPLGADHSSDSLLATGSPEMQSLSGKLAGMDATQGMGMLRLLGYLSFRQLINAPEFISVLGDIVDEILIQTDGQPRPVLLHADRGIAGGVGPDGWLVSERVAAHVHKVLDVPVHIDEDLNGFLVHAGLGQRLTKNTIASIIDRADYILSKPGPPLITRSFSAVEYVPCRNNRQKSDRFIAQDEQVIASDDYQAWSRLTTPNFSLTGPLGSIRLRRVDYFTTLDSGIVANEVADSLSRDLHNILSRAKPDHSIDLQIQLTEELLPAHRDSLESIAETAPSREFDDVVSDISAPGHEITSTALASTNGGHPIELQDAAIHYAKAPSSPDHALQLLVQQATSLEALDYESETVQQKYDQVQEKLARAERRLSAPYRALRSSALSGRRYRAFLSASQHLRDVADQTHLLDAKLNALAIAYNAVSTEFEHLKAHISGITSTLDSLRPNSIREQTEPHVLAKSLAEVWSEIWTLSVLPRNKQEIFVAAAVNEVTLVGLAKVVGIDSPRLESIALQIAEGKFAVVGPPWAGKPATPGDVIYAFPPLSAVNRPQLAAMIEHRVPSSTVVFTDTAQCGVNVLRFEISAVTAMDQLCRGPLRFALTEAMKSEIAAGFFPHGTSHYDRHNINPDSSNASTKSPVSTGNGKDKA